MDHRRSVVARSLAASLLALLPTTASAQPTADLPAEARVGWHVVRPGETLEYLADRYLGNSGRWRTLAGLNAHIADPNLINPGQRIKIAVLPDRARPAAQVQRLSRRVDERPAPIPWGQAQLGDVLIEKDGVRTYAKSSAELRFTDGTRLGVTEDSLIFLRNVGGELSGVERKAVEIIDGQAEFETRAAAGAARAAEVELLVGGTRAKTRTNAAGLAQTRARKADLGAAKVMVYGGSGQVEAAGARVDVAEGMGTSVEAGRKPGPPEKLLPAPTGDSPPPGARIAARDASFTWQPVGGAASYIVEVCRDEACGETVARATDVKVASWNADQLPEGALYWRATARSASGLDGYPGGASAFEVTSAPAPVPVPIASGPPPSATFELAGTAIRVGDVLFGNAETRVVLTGERSSCAIASRAFDVDGGAVAALGTLAAGAHVATATLTDSCGQSAAVGPFAFTIDAAPPAIQAKTVGHEIFEDRGEPDRERRREPRNWQPARGGAIAWSADGRRWLPLTWGETPSPPADGIWSESAATANQPQVLFAATGWKLVADDGTTVADQDRFIYLTAADAESGIAKLVYRTKPASDGTAEAVLEVEAIDLVGNASVRSFRITRR